LQLVRVSADGVRRVRQSQLHLVDLAGSERQKDTHASGVRLREACAINQSLSTLGNCIKALVSGQTKPPYRESKLTFLLKDSLGGNAKTCIVANVSALDRCCAETLGTLRFAQRAKMMPNRAVVNEESHGSVVALREEIARLRAQLEQTPALVSPGMEARAQGSDDSETRMQRLQELLRGTMAQQQDLQVPNLLRLGPLTASTLSPSIHPTPIPGSCPPLSPHRLSPTHQPFARSLPGRARPGVQAAARLRDHSGREAEAGARSASAAPLARGEALRLARSGYDALD
jgi:hypothetical protein